MKVSVLMATFNGTAFLQEQLASILEGERLPDELIIVDDCSSDGTVELTKRTCLQYPSVHTVLLQNESNMGPSRTFMRAVAHSSGDLLLFADQDDVWLPRKIKSFVDHFAERTGLLMAYSDGSIVNAAMEATGHSIFSTRNKAHLDQGGDRAPLEVAANPDIKGCTMALDGQFTRSLFAETDPAFVGYWGHDHWAALFAYGMGPVDVINAHLIKHRIHGGNASAGMRFNPFSAAHRRDYLKKVRGQGNTYFVERYGAALAQATQFGTRFSPALLEALHTLVNISERRQDLRSLSFPRRFGAAWKLYREGVYTKFYNGIYTLLRDTLL